MGVGSKIYSDAAKFGKITTILRAIFGTLLSVVLIIAGIAMINSKGVLTEETTSGVVINSPTCVQQSSNNQIQYQCNSVQVQYTAKDTKQYEITFNTTSYTNYTKGLSPITVYYDPTNPKNGSVTSDSKKLPGWIALGIGVVILIGVWISLYLIRYKVFAAAEGVNTGIGMVSSAVRGI